VAEFVVVTCALGLERLAKPDLAARWPAWRLAFSRPGMITFKTDAAVDPAAPAPTPFARVWARSLGRDEDPAAAAGGPIDRVHVFARDPDADGAAEAIAAADVEVLPGVARGPAAAGDRVLDVIVAPGEQSWRGVHVHAAWRSPHPGGAIPIEVPAEAPSRAYAKLEEAIAWAHPALPIGAGDTALEIGSAPGGAALALVRRGVTVIGVDSGAMDPNVLAYRHGNGARVEHLAIKVGALRWEQLPERVDWLLVDVNLAPQVALHEIARLMPRLRPTLRGAVLTLKLNDLAVAAELPALVARIHALGFAAVHLTHLPANRQELCAVALV
jgi:23S rRNA (cytidine2498-2'-O)-methyltransferase